MKPEEKAYTVEVGAMTLNKNEFLKRCRVEVYDPLKLSWEEVKADILNIEQSAFKEGQAFDEEMLEADFKDSDSIIVFVRDIETNKIVGYTYAKSTMKTYPEEYPERTASENTAYIYNVALEPFYQKRGLFPPLAAKLEELLIQRGFMFVEQDNMDDRSGKKEDEETFADKIRKNNLDRIVFQEKHDSPDYGPQVFFRIKLPKVQ